MVTLNRNDLSHILAQIRIAEAHTARINGGQDPGAALADLVSSPLLPFGLRTVDGSFNNFQPGMERFGASDEVMARLLTPVYNPAETNPRTGNPTSYEQTSGSVYDSQPRTISNLVADQTLNNPAAIAAALQVAGVTGAAQLAAVQAITAAQQTAAQQLAAVAGAAAAAAAAQAAAQAAVDQASAGQAGAAQALADAQAAATAADAALVDAQARLDTALVALAAFGPPNDAVVQAEAAVAVAQAAADAAGLTAADAAQVLADAEAALTAAQQALAEAQVAGDLALQAHEVAAADLLAAQTALAEAEAAVLASAVDPQVLADAMVARDQAQADVTAAQSAVDAAGVALGAAQADVDAAQAMVDAAQAERDAALAARDAADAEAAATQATLNQEEAELTAARQAEAASLAVLLATPNVANAMAYIAAAQQAEAAQAERDAAFTADANADQAAADAQTALNTAEAALATAQAALSDKTALRDAAQAVADQAALDLLAAEGVLTQAIADLETAQAGSDAHAAAIAARDAAAASLTLAEAAALAAETALATAAEALTTAEATAEAAQAEVDARTAEKALADAALAEAQATLAAAETALTAAEADAVARAAAEAEYDAAVLGLQAAETAVTEAATALGTAETALTAANTAVAEAEAAFAALPDPAEATAAAEAAAAAAEAAVMTMVADYGIEMDGENVFIRNIAADLGDTASFNGFMTIFGQFFDHGLDLTAKGGSGNVIIPLSPDDPLYVPGSATNFMVLTRATNDPGPDGILGNADDLREHRNETTAWIDLNQVYTSNPSHQVFLREYVMVDGHPVATGQMLEGIAGGPPTWADIKAQARSMLGIELSDLNVHSVPLVLTDLYGNFVPGENGLPQLMTAGGPVEGSLTAPLDAMSGLSAGRAFLNDIAHSAAPSGPVDHDRNPLTPRIEVLADADDVAGNPITPNAFGVNVTYDNELLDAHYIVGDGRGNENVALTAVHTIFHGEHNRQVDAIKEMLLAEGDIAFLNEWLRVDVTSLPADPASLEWDGERLFQAARFSTEMVYQHLVFEEFVRAIAPQIDPFVFSNSVEIDGAIFEEFAQVVYRFGHSMLNETVELLNFTGTAASPEEMGLIEAFLNPLAFDGAGADAEAAAGAILRGMTRQAGNEIDEFMTEALRNNLVGLPLDLAALNMARARDTGVPSLNEARAQLFSQTNDTYLKPYASWTEFAQNLKNPMSIVNFIASYGQHDTITAATTMEEKRAAASALVFGGADAPADRLAFLNGRGAWSAENSGLNDVDFWIGGLAEALMPFGGMLGSTFTFVFELQMEKLQAGDRFYYLSRTQGMNLLTQLEGDSFAELIRRNTDTEHTGLHINGAAFQTADYILEMDQALQYNEGLGSDDPTRAADVLSYLTGDTALVVRENPDGRAGNYLQYLGGEHVVLGGTDAVDTIIGGAGDDAVWGEGGDDRIEGGYGVDHLHGGAGHDIITDSGTDVGAADVIKGEAGDDVINAGMGLDLVFGGDGRDVLSGGSEAKDIFGGAGDDFIRAPSGGGGVVQGNEGNDWMEGQGNMNTLTGENSELFFNSRIIGHDVMLAGENDTDFDAESGDDIMVQGIGINRNNGMAGFDWTTYQGNTQAANADMNIGIFVNQQNNILRDRFDLVEGLSGWNHDDRLTGREVVTGAADPGGNAAQVAPDAPIESFSNVLLEKNLGLIDGLADLVAHLQRFEVRHPDGTTPEVLTGVMDTSDGSDILLGGGGSDIIRGMAGNDIIDGDKWLSVRIGINDAAGNAIATAAGLTKQVFDLGGNLMFGGRTLESLLFSRDLVASQLEVLREILTGGSAADTDVAVFWDVQENYTITRNADGSVTVTHDTATPGKIDPGTGRALALEGSDRLTNVEILRFGDGDLRTADIAPPDRPTTGLPVILDVSPTAGEAVSVNLAGIADPDGILSRALQWQASADGGATWTNIPGATVANFTPGAAQALSMLRVSATVTDLNGVQTILTSAATDVVGAVITGNNNGNTLTGTAGGDLITGNRGNDAITAGASDDVVVWNATALQNDGRDTVDGGTETAVGDRFIVNGSALAETFRIYTLTEWQALGGNRTVAAGTEIIITRNGTNNGSVIAELREIEEITINTGAGGLLGDNDQVMIFGDFNQTSLFFNTITINGGAGSSTVDISGLISDHRILFRTGGGNDFIVGTLRAQDVIEAPEGIDPASYVASFDPETGLVTLSTEGSSITFTGTLDSLPEVLTPAEAAALPAEEPATPGEEVQTTGTDPEADPAYIGLSGSDEADTLAGDTLADQIRGHREDDQLEGHAGDDWLNGNRESDLVLGGLGDDILRGGLGHDTVRGQAGNDTIIERVRGGNDLLDGGAGRDTVDLSRIFSDLEIDLGGLTGEGRMQTADQTDQLLNIEDVIAGAGNDRIIASTAANRMTGGEGDDIFAFLSAETAEGDHILDFAPGDRIDLSEIDADTGTAGQQSFTLATADASPAAGLLVLSETTGGATLVEGHTDEDGTADFTITVTSRAPLTADSFGL